MPQGKTDAKDAFVVADRARMRKDLGVLRPGDEIAVDLKILVRRRTDLVNDRTRQINRLREQLLEIFPVLERSLSPTNKGPILLPTGYQTPAAIRRSGVRRIEARFHEHPHAEVIRCLPGMGAVLGATSVAATGGGMQPFGTADRLAAFADLSPVPRDCGRVSGNMRRSRRYHRGLLRDFYLSSMAGLRSCPASRAYYERKRAEGKRHKQAVLSLARRRTNVLWTVIRDGACCQAAPSVTAAA